MGSRTLSDAQKMSECTTVPMRNRSQDWGQTFENATVSNHSTQKSSRKQHTSQMSTSRVTMEPPATVDFTPTAGLRGICSFLIFYGHFARVSPRSSFVPLYLC